MIFIASFFSAFSQTDSTAPPYKRYPTLPPFQVMLSDSSIYSKAQLPKNKPVLFMIFDPECSHCQHEAEELVAHKNDFKDIQIVMITMPGYSFDQINDFFKTYNLNELKHVVAGKDIYTIMPSFFVIHNFPYLAMYNKKGNLITTFEGSMPVAKVIEAFKQGK